MKMEKQKALDVINTMDFIESDSDGEACYYVLVENNEKNRKIITEVLLHTGKAKENSFQDYCTDYASRDNQTIDVSPLAFEFSEWWDGNEFLLKQPTETY